MFAPWSEFIHNYLHLFIKKYSNDTPPSLYVTSIQNIDIECQCLYAYCKELLEQNMWVNKVDSTKMKILRHLVCEKMVIVRVLVFLK